MSGISSKQYGQLKQYEQFYSLTSETSASWSGFSSIQILFIYNEKFYQMLHTVERHCRALSLYLCDSQSKFFWKFDKMLLSTSPGKECAVLFEGS